MAPVTWLVFRNSSDQIYWDRRTSVASHGIQCYLLSPFARCVVCIVCAAAEQQKAKRSIGKNNFKTNNQTLCTFASSIVVSIRSSRQINIETWLQINFPFFSFWFGDKPPLNGWISVAVLHSSQSKLANGTNGPTSFVPIVRHMCSPDTEFICSHAEPSNYSLRNFDSMSKHIFSTRDK